jgi:hypothetical protein
MRIVVFTVALAAAAAASVTGSGASVSDNARPTRAQIVLASFDALNDGDAAASAAYFAEDGELVTPLAGCNPCTGRDVIQQRLSAAIANGTTVTVVGRPTVKGANVVTRVEVRASRFPPGVERVLGIYRSTVRRGLIVRQTNDYDRSDPQTAALLAIIERATTTTIG